MFDEILQLVREHLGNNPQVAAAIPAGQTEAVHQEIASHLTNTLQNQPAPSGTGDAGILSGLESKFASGNMLTTAVTGGLVSSLASKFGLPPVVTGAIAAALPGLIQKYTQRHTGQAG